MRTRIAVAASAAIAVALPATADAATKVVDAGTPRSDQRSFRPYDADVNAFFPSAVTIRVGDSVRFRPSGFHNVDIPAKGERPLPTFMPNGQKVAGAVDAAGAPYWFNGLDVIGPNGADFAPGSWGKNVSYNGTRRVQSGAPTGPRTKPMTVRFTKTGTVTYFCDIHPGMKGTVRVRGRSAKVPSARADARAKKDQVARALRRAKQAAAVRPADDTTVLLGSAAPGGVESFRFFPSRLKVNVGDAVTFRMSRNSYEAHTATTGPGSPEDRDSFLGKLFGSLEGPAPDPAAVYPSDPPSGAAQLTPTSHGNGFYNSGVLDSVKASPLPESNTVRIAEAGTYTFYCVIHPFMKGTVVAE
jgi:plastocyanin